MAILGLNRKAQQGANRFEVLLVWILRLVGSAALLAIVPAVMPLEWMDVIHRRLGLGPLPTGPVVGYLARSTSFFYAMFGGLMWLVSFRPRQHRMVLLYLGSCGLLLGLFLAWFDHQQQLPLWWNVTEGVVNVTVGLAILVCTAFLQGE